MVVSKRWFEFSGGTKFRYPPFYLILTSFLPHFYLILTSFLPQFYLLLTSFLPLFNLNLTSSSSRLSNHGLETTVYIPLGQSVLWSYVLTVYLVGPIFKASKCLQ